MERGVQPFTAWKELGWLSLHSLPQAEAFWDDPSKEDIAGTEEARNSLWKLKKKGLCFLLCNVNMQMDLHMSTLWSKCLPGKIQRWSLGLAQEEDGVQDCFQCPFPATLELMCDIPREASMLVHDHEELISPWRYFLSHCHLQFHTQGALPVFGDLPLTTQSKSRRPPHSFKWSEPFLLGKPHCPLPCVGSLEFVPGRHWGSADSCLCSVRGPGSTNTSHLPSPKPAWGTLLVEIHSLSSTGSPDGNVCCPARTQTCWSSFPLPRVHTNIQGTPGALGLLLLTQTQLICIYSMTTSGKTACVKPRHNFQAWKRVCSETPDIF